MMTYLFLHCTTVLFLSAPSIQVHIASTIADSPMKVTVDCQRTTTAIVQATMLLARLAVAQKPDSAAIDSLVGITSAAHDDALQCTSRPQSHLTAMMLLAVSNSAQKLLSVTNVLMFRMSVRNTQLFLIEARKYWDADDNSPSPSSPRTK
jgi:hypothetical protein